MIPVILQQASKADDAWRSFWPDVAASSLGTMITFATGFALLRLTQRFAREESMAARSHELAKEREDRAHAQAESTRAYRIERLIEAIALSNQLSTTSHHFFLMNHMESKIHIETWRELNALTAKLIAACDAYGRLPEAIDPRGVLLGSQMELLAGFILSEILSYQDHGLSAEHASTKIEVIWILVRDELRQFLANERSEPTEQLSFALLDEYPYSKFCLQLEARKKALEAAERGE